MESPKQKVIWKVGAIEMPIVPHCTVLPDVARNRRKREKIWEEKEIIGGGWLSHLFCFILHFFLRLIWWRVVEPSILSHSAFSFFFQFA